MKRNKRSIALTWLTCLALVLSLCAGIIRGDRATAAPSNQQGQSGSAKGRKDRVASDLREKMRKNVGGDVVKVIVQLNADISGPLKALFQGNGIKVKRSFASFNTLAVELPANVVDSLASFPEVEFISVDSEVRSFGGHIAKTTGADNVRLMGPLGTKIGRASCRERV